MRRKDNIERLDEELAQCLRRVPAAFDFEEWARNHPDAAARVRSGLTQDNSRSRIHFAHIWRCIMESPYTRYVSAGIILLALLGSLFPGGNASLALADVQKAMEEMQTARYRYAEGFPRRGKGAGPQVHRGKAVLDLPRVRGSDVRRRRAGHRIHLPRADRHGHRSVSAGQALLGRTS